MSNKVYKEASDFRCTIDSQSIAKDYDEMAVSISKMIGKLDQYRDRAQYLSDVTGDNGDPQMDLTECIEKLGMALATIICYKTEYLEEANS